jgi:hypothetical protein
MAIQFGLSKIAGGFGMGVREYETLQDMNAPELFQPDVQDPERMIWISQETI